MQQTAIPDESRFPVTYRGFCPICEHSATFVANHSWYRDHLICQSCINGSVPRERALALVLNREAPNWRSATIHESSPAERGLSAKLALQASSYVATQFFPGAPLGSRVKGWRNENIEAQTFADESFDIVVCLDVSEHVFHPDAMFCEVWRTLRPGGIFLSTFPIQKGAVAAAVPLAQLAPDGAIRFLRTPAEYHGNPVNAEGALVTWEYGYEIHDAIRLWAPFAVEIVRFADTEQGILGDYTEVVICRKRNA